MAASRDLETALQQAQITALVDHARANPHMTIGELVALSGGVGALARRITVAELVGKAAPKATRRRRPASAAKAKEGSGKVKRKGAVNTKTAAGRKAYDDAVLKALKRKKQPVAAEVLIGEVGGTAAQARTALKRLKKHVRRTGKARGTRYVAR